MNKMRTIRKIILHCSDSDLSQHDNVETIRSWHLARGWKDIGYHFVITKEGRIRWGRALGMYGAHCSGNNKDSIGICLTGRHHFSKAQFNSLRMLLIKLMRDYQLPKTKIYGHNHFNKYKSCPNFDVEEVLQTIS
ncbi:N-acetylmuramoyl-L-alanine amidase [Halosquirtibacter laminarini]|uniref:N-acetylmuramoyl-L-alanine amidase n=1 Tax=Halosquirtibacter laminarini TaxID=3374600 RepID=A0AC61NHW8_9BACT|nr:N-acetylmuramoyl-L-alanine amidase [Prolixibacteraceae bacterium]